MQRATAQAKRGSLDAASGGSGGAGKYAAAAHKLLDEVTDMLDEAEQDQIIKDFEAEAARSSTAWRSVFGLGALGGCLFFLYAAWRQHVDPFGVRYTGEFSSVAGAAEVCTALAVQSLSFLLYSVVFVLLPRTGRGGYIPPSATAAAATASGSSNNNASSSDAGVGDTQQPGPPPTALATLRVKVCLSAGFLSSWLVCGYWVYAMNEMKAKHGKHWQLDVALLWLPLGGPLYGFLVGYVLHAMQGIATDIDALRRQRYKYKKV